MDEHEKYESELLEQIVEQKAALSDIEDAIEQDPSEDLIQVISLVMYIHASTLRHAHTRHEAQGTERNALPLSWHHAFR